MAKKKIRDPKKRMKTRITVVIIGILLVVFVGGLSVESFARSYIMKFDNKRISSNEYKFYLASFGESAVDVLTNRLVVEKKAQEFALEIDKENENNEEMLEALDSYLDVLENGGYIYGLKEKDITRIFDREMLTDALFEHATADFSIDEDEFAEFLAEERHNQRLFQTEVMVNYIVTETEDEAKEILDMVENGADFKELVPEYCIEYTPPEPFEDDYYDDYDEYYDDYYPVEVAEMEAPEGLFGHADDDVEIQINNDEADADSDNEDEDVDGVEIEIPDPRVIGQSAIFLPHFPSDDIDEIYEFMDMIYAMPAGEITEPIEIEGVGFMLVRVDSNTPMSADEVAEFESEAREQFEMMKKNEAYSEMLEEWKTESGIKVNEYARRMIRV